MRRQSISSSADGVPVAVDPRIPGALSRTKGDLKNVKVIDDIRAKLLDAPAVAEDDEDPMAALDELGQAVVKVSKRP